MSNFKENKLTIMKKLTKKYNVSYSATRTWALGYEEFGIKYLEKISSRKGQTTDISKIDYELKNNPLKKEVLELKNQALGNGEWSSKKVQSIPGGLRKKTANKI